ncbi:MAG: sugar phosphate isomerase/epimerase family protein, partial [Bacteroidota bacterium]
MKLGMMNFPAANIFNEIEWAAKKGFDYIDLSLEPPQAYIDILNPEEIKSALKKNKLEVVGHTAYYFPIGSPITALRNISVKEIIACIEFFQKVGAEKVNIHPDFNQPAFFSETDAIKFNTESLTKIVNAAEKIGLTVMLENADSCIPDLEKIFLAVGQLKFHFDLGHANLMPGECNAEKMLNRFLDRLIHVHLSDNKGGYNDLHIPLGTGNVNWEDAVGLLKRIGYN